MKKIVLAALLFCFVFAAPAIAADGTTTLKDSVVAAVKQHPQIKSLMHNKDAVSKAQLSALGRFFPSLDLRAEAGYQQYNSPATRH